MRKHDVRKWLHAILDLLPVILIPVFMIYSHRHDVTERTDVEVTYKYQSNEVNSYDDLVEDNIYLVHAEDLHSEDIIGNGYIKFRLLTNLNFNNSLYVEETQSNYLSFINVDQVVSFDNGSYISFYSNDSYSIENYYMSCDTDYSQTYITNNFIIQLIICEDIDYTLFSYTDYNVIESVEINDTKSSVMNVFMDDFNNSIDKYFNMGNVFNLNGVYEWFNTNIFSGNAPTIIYSIWNIALYELVMDLLFLLYGLFMWFIDIVENIMNKPFKSIK